MAISLAKPCVFRVLQHKANEIKKAPYSRSPIFFILL